MGQTCANHLDILRACRAWNERCLKFVCTPYVTDLSSFPIERRSLSFNPNSRGVSKPVNNVSSLEDDDTDQVWDKAI